MKNATEFLQLASNPDKIIKMVDLRTKIEELMKALLTMGKPDLFVPEIKAPTLKAPKIPKASNTTKLPGITPASKKDPKKVAEQLKNPHPKKVKTEMLKVENNGQWSLTKDESTVSFLSPSQTKKKQVGLKSPVSAKLHGFTGGYHLPEQNNLIEGIDVRGAQPIRGNGVDSREGVAGAKFATTPNHPHKLILKNASEHPNRSERGHLENNLSSAKREVLYHNLARDFFGMGKHVPTTAGFTKNGEEYSVMKEVPNASHINIEPHITGKNKIQNPNHERVLNKLHASGDIDKMSIMDHIMGHHDRHAGNYLIDDKGDNLHLIDNGTAFDYKNFDPRDVPSFHSTLTSRSIQGMGKDNSKLHPEAANWLTSLQPNKAKKLLAAHGHDENSPATQGFLKRLEGLKEKVKQGKYKTVDDLLNQNRTVSGPMYPHPTED